MKYKKIVFRISSCRSCRISFLNSISRPTVIRNRSRWTRFPISSYSRGRRRLDFPGKSMESEYNYIVKNVKKKKLVYYNITRTILSDPSRGVKRIWGDEKPRRIFAGKFWNCARSSTTWALIMRVNERPTMTTKTISKTMVRSSSVSVNFFKWVGLNRGKSLLLPPAQIIADPPVK